MNNKRLRDLLANFNFDAATHLLTSITYGTLFIFSIGFQNDWLENYPTMLEVGIFCF
jgi:hypothetical protein